MEYSGWAMALTNSPTLVSPFTISSITTGFKLQLLPWMKGLKFIPPLYEFMNVQCTEPVTDVLVKKTEKLDTYDCLSGMYHYPQFTSVWLLQYPTQLLAFK
jgi:hypothetical protein